MDQPDAEPAVEYRVTAPGPVTGGVMGVAFANGHALVTDLGRHGRALVWLQQAGYDIQPPAPVAEPEPEPEPVPEPEPEPVPEPEPPADDPAPDEEPPDEDDSED